MVCAKCGESDDVQEVTLTIESQTLVMELCGDDRASLFKQWARYGHEKRRRPQRSSPEGHAVKPFTFKPGG